jgi:hypothetical protein
MCTAPTCERKGEHWGGPGLHCLAGSLWFGSVLGVEVVLVLMCRGGWCVCRG